MGSKPALMVHDPIREFIRAFNERDLDAFEAVLDPEVELHSMKGLRKGHEAARLWATRAPGGVQQTIELDELYEGGTESGGGSAVALIRRVWHWDEDGSAAGEDEMAWLFELHDHRVRSWRPFDDRSAALRAGGFLHPEMRS
ncbi:MAG TPA: nuclear transport factor 2 family protein [Solirubrobacterales bacterium]|jgi:limonene-1,2-epoxide hydrolase|nr:nuclear transport factor 2 family protein [Solirubrobacterales bacterium]